MTFYQCYRVNLVHTVCLQPSPGSCRVLQICSWHCSGYELSSPTQTSSLTFRLEINECLTVRGQQSKDSRFWIFKIQVYIFKILYLYTSITICENEEKLCRKLFSYYVFKSRKISDGFILVEVLYILVYAICRHDADLKASRASKCKPVQGSPCWMAPELLETGDITTKADVYSFAIVLWEMLTRKQPFENFSVYQVCRIII